MEYGKRVCETLKGVRRDIARANEIDYEPIECNHEGDCAGTCPACESEVRWLESQLQLRRRLGKAVTIAGLSLSVGALASCGQQQNVAEGYMDEGNDTTEVVLDGDVAPMPLDSAATCDTTAQALKSAAAALPPETERKGDTKRSPRNNTGPRPQPPKDHLGGVVKEDHFDHDWGKHPERSTKDSL